MRKPNGIGLVAVILVLAAIAFLAASLLPFFIYQAWDPLWGADAGQAARPRSFVRVGPLCGVGRWPAILVVPISSALVLAFFSLVVTLYVLGQRRR